METVTMLEIRRNAKQMVERLEQGESFRLTYRNRTVGELHPAVKSGGGSADDPIYSLCDEAEDFGGSLSARSADALIYGR